MKRHPNVWNASRPPQPLTRRAAEDQEDEHAAPAVISRKIRSARAPLLRSGKAVRSAGGRCVHLTLALT